jgi:hypothetical protein
MRRNVYPQCVIPPQLTRFSRLGITEVLFGNFRRSLDRYPPVPRCGERIGAPYQMVA